MNPCQLHLLSMLARLAPAKNEPWREGARTPNLVPVKHPGQAERLGWVFTKQDYYHVPGMRPDLDAPQRNVALVVRQ